MKKQLKVIPTFNTEDEEAQFWATHDTTEYFDYSKRVHIDFSNLHPSTEKITLRLPKILLRSLKLFARKQDVPYQSLMKMLLSQKINELTSK